MGSDRFYGGIPFEQLEPADWFVVFHPRTHRRWLSWLAMGKYKHVSAFGWVPRAQTWVFFDFNVDRSRIYVVGNHEADELLERFTHQNTVVRMARPLVESDRINFGAGLWCVPAVAHLIGLRASALRPDALFRQCLANGGEIIGKEAQVDENQSPERPRAGAPAGGRVDCESEVDTGSAVD